MNYKKGVIISIFIIIAILIICIGIYVTTTNNNKNLNLEVKFLEATSPVKATNSGDIEKNKNIEINGEKLNLEYKETMNNLNIYYTTDKKDQYIFKDGKLVGFLKAMDLNNIQDSELDMESAKKIAEKFGKDNIKNFNKYELTYENFINSYKEYSFTYMRKIKGIDTIDTVDINVNENGEIMSFSATNQGEFEKYKNIKIDTEVVNNLCLEAVKNKYGERIKETKIQNQYFKMLDEKLVLQTDISIVLNNDQSSTLTEIHEAESLICEIK